MEIFKKRLTLEGNGGQTTNPITLWGIIYLIYLKYIQLKIVNFIIIIVNFIITIINFIIMTLNIIMKMVKFTNIIINFTTDHS